MIMHHAGRHHQQNGCVAGRRIKAISVVKRHWLIEHDGENIVRDIHRWIIQNWVKRFSRPNFREPAFDTDGRPTIFTRMQRCRSVLRRPRRFGKVPFMRLKALFGLLLMFFAPGAAPGWAQSKINFKVIPILQPMKEAAPTLDFSLTDLRREKFL